MFRIGKNTIICQRLWNNTEAKLSAVYRARESDDAVEIAEDGKIPRAHAETETDYAKLPPRVLLFMRDYGRA